MPTQQDRQNIIDVYIKNTNVNTEVKNETMFVDFYLQQVLTDYESHPLTDGARELAIRYGKYEEELPRTPQQLCRGVGCNKR